MIAPLESLVAVSALKLSLRSVSSLMTVRVSSILMSLLNGLSRSIARNGWRGTGEYVVEVCAAPRSSQASVVGFQRRYVKLDVVGVGLVVSGASTARGILATRPRAVVHVGACGVYPNIARYKPLDVVIPTRLQLVDNVVLQAHGAFADPMITMVES